MINTIKQPANRAMPASQQQAHYSGDYDRRANDRADNHSRKFHECRANWAAKAKERAK